MASEGIIHIFRHWREERQENVIRNYLGVAIKLFRAKSVLLIPNQPQFHQNMCGGLRKSKKNNTRKSCQELLIKRALVVKNILKR